MVFLKKAILLLLAVCSPVLCDQLASTSFKGLDNNESSVIIDPSYAQDLLNVDVTPGGKSFKKRSGYGLYKALSTAKPVRGGFHAFDPSGNDYQLWVSSTSLYAVVADGPPTQLVSSATINSTWDCADTQGNSYCVNSSRDFMIRTDGATTTFISSASAKGTMVETTPDRLVVAGVSLSPNTLFVSQSNTFTNFTVGVNATDAFQEVIASPGSKLTHIRWGCGKLLFWKDSSFGYFDFDDQFSAQVKTVSDTIGTFDNTSAIDPGGNVWFRGQDGHTWKYDCSSLSKESIDITPNVQASGNRISNSWTQTTASDFVSGSILNLDTATTSGVLQIPHLNEPFTDLSQWTNTVGVWGVSSGQITPSSYAGGANVARIEGPTLSGANTSLAFYAKAVIQMTCDTGCPIVGIGARSSSFDADGDVVYLTASAGGNFLVGISSGLFSSGYADTGIPRDTSSHFVELRRSNAGVMTSYFDGNIVGGVTDTSHFPMTPAISATTHSGHEVGARPTVLDYAFSYSTGVYYSAVHNAPNLSSWNSLAANYQSDSGSQVFYLRASTNSFTVLSSTPAWTAQTPGSLITISTGSYFQFRDDYTASVASATVALNDFTINWAEGTASDQAYIYYFDNAIWESVTFGSGQTKNNYIFKKDLINDGWTLYNFGAGGMLVQNNILYFGDTTLGNIFSYGSSTSDNGTAINAFWKSKDFSGSDPFLQTQLTNIDTFARKNQGTTLLVSYVMDTSTTTSYNMGLSDTARTIIQSRKLLPSGKLGQVFNVKYADTSTSSAWEVLGFRIGYTQLPYRPTN